ncbi:Uncharacterised protein [Mycobacteroides abscessus subsp. abscessus]|nr:Uncharacterised protein [Mycobacteroides abscessus subsp. abscessus]
MVEVDVGCPRRGGARRRGGRGPGVGPVPCIVAGFGGNDPVRGVLLAEFDAEGVELVVLQFDGLDELATPRRVAEESVEARPSLLSRLSRGEAERLRDRSHVDDALHRPVDDPPADGLPFLAVRLEQRRLGLSAQHRRELPSEIVGILDRRVRPQAVGWRVPVGGVAGEERPALPVLVGDDMVDLPLRDLLDAHLDVGVADRRLGECDERLVARVRFALGGVVHAQEDPLGEGPDVDPRPRAHPVVVARLRHPVEGAGPVVAVLREVGVEPDVQRRAEPRLAGEGEVELLGDRRATAVGADDVLREDERLLPGVAVAHGRLDALGRLDRGDELRREPQVGPETAGRLGDDGFEDVLRDVAHRAGTGDLVVTGAGAAGAPRLEAGDLLSGEARRPDVVAHVRVRGGHGDDVVLDAEIAEDLHRALVGDVRPGRVRGRRIAGDGDRVDAVAGEDRRERESGRAGPDDEDIGAGGSGRRGHCSFSFGRECGRGDRLGEGGTPSRRFGIINHDEFVASRVPGQGP